MITNLLQVKSYIVTANFIIALCEHIRMLRRILSISSSVPIRVMRQLERDTCHILLDFSLTVKAATLIFISGCGSAISSAKEGKSGFICNLVKSK